MGTGKDEVPIHYMYFSLHKQCLPGASVVGELSIMKPVIYCKILQTSQYHIIYALVKA